MRSWRNTKLNKKWDNILKEIGRIHTLKEFEEAYNLARKVGFDNINVDLMHGLPNQKLEDFKESVNYLLKLNPEHISCYSLILHNDIFKTQLQNNCYIVKRKEYLGFHYF